MNTSLGLIGIVLVWLTMAMVPLAEILELSAFEATFLRGISGVIIIGSCALIRPGLVTRPDTGTLSIVVYFVLATLCLFQALSVWGANFSALFLDLAVIVPLFFAWKRGVRLTQSTVLALLCALAGTMIALRVFAEGSFSVEGMAWSMGALFFNGLFIQYAGQAKQENWNKAFWMSAGLVVAGSPVLLSVVDNMNTMSTSKVFIGLVFAITTGVLNFYSVFLAFKHLSAVSVGVLVLGVTPTIMVSSYLMLGTTMGVDQVFGVVLTLTSVAVFGVILRTVAK